MASRFTLYVLLTAVICGARCTGQTAISNSTPVAITPASEQNRRYYENVKADPQYDWKQPIDFYGRVVDESNQPVAGASVDYTWSTIAKNGTLTKQDEADALGAFSIHEKGKRISITVSKEGYYTPRNEKLRSFEYANPGDGLFTPDIANPVVFHLRKKGQADPLIKSEQKIKIALGSQVPFDLKTCRTNSGDATIEFELIKNKGGNTNRTEWVFRITALNGGTQFATNEFSFLAPTNDYQSSIDMTLDSPRPEDWRNNGYSGGVAFVKTGAGFGKVEIRMVPRSSYFRLVSYFNPSGSRNLEFDPAKEIQPQR
jgi:hypothetical protein